MILLLTGLNNVEKKLLGFNVSTCSSNYLADSQKNAPFSVAHHPSKNIVATIGQNAN